MEDLQPVADKFREHLQHKNVVFDITNKLCESVTQSFVGKKIGAFEGVHKTVKSGLEESLISILTPKQNVELVQGYYSTQKGKSESAIQLVFHGL